MRRRSVLLVALLVALLWPAGIVSAALRPGLHGRHRASGSAAGQRRHKHPGAVGAPLIQGLQLRVRPAVGRRRSHFVVSFNAGLTGFTFPDTTSYRVVASGGSSRTCRSTRGVSVPPTTPGQRVHVTLMPSGHSGLWCAGRYTGRLLELFRPVCGFRQMCPLMGRLRPTFIVIRSLQTFHYRVR